MAQAPRMPLARSFRDVPIRSKLLLLSLLTSTVGLLPAATALIVYVWTSTQASSVRDLETLARITADGVVAALTFNDPAAARETLAALHAKPEVDRACLYGAAGGVRLFASYQTADENCPPSAGTAGTREDFRHLVSVVPVQLAEETIGSLLVSQNLDARQRAISVQIGVVLAILGAAFLASVAVGWRLQRGLSEPLLDLAEMARRITGSGDYRLRAERRGGDEIGALVDDFNRMLEQIATRDRELQEARDALTTQVQEKTHANTELESALLRLREAQTQLVQSEKMASLGALVAGVAHEINTPVGVGVTAASTLKMRTQQMRGSYAGGTLSRTDLDTYVDIAMGASDIILRNLQRAADLIQSFKQVAVDQSSDERRHFALQGYIDEVLLSLAPRLKKTPHHVEVDCPADIMVDSYPGALAQILTNLVGNALMHAVPGDRPGSLRIEARVEAGWVQLRFSDNGVGIPAADLNRIFDPFFTTKRGSGGSGLGLHIVYNLATQMLRGRISASSEPGHGAEFLLQFPLNVAEPSP